MCLILICYTQIIDFILKLLSFNVYHIQIWRATWGAEITLPRFDLFMISFLLTTNEREKSLAHSQDVHWVILWRLFHVWHTRKSRLYITLIQCYLQRYIIAAADTLNRNTKMQVFSFPSKFFHSLALHCSSLYLPTALQLSVLHTLTPSHQKSVQHQSVLQHGCIQVLYSSSYRFKKDQMCFDTSVLIVSARLYSPFLKAFNTKDSAWLTATSSHIAILRENICTLRIMKSNDRENSRSASQVAHRRWSFFYITVGQDETLTCFFPF